MHPIALWPEQSVSGEERLAILLLLAPVPWIDLHPTASLSASATANAPLAWPASTSSAATLALVLATPMLSVE